MKRILPEYTFTDEQLNNIKDLARECKLCEDTVKILYGRGVRDVESVQKFMHPSKSHFISPFKMSGMDGAVKLITQARDEGWQVVVYGDYDADGICASTVMGNALRDFGIEPYVCVPERSDGYGLSVNLIDKIFDEYFPQLFITVDCGISCAEEVEYIKELGAEVIVTDHHELPENIPDCICINPKFKDDYIYDNLCGAGVAFKVACALLGTDAYKYLDFAAIATVADSVPLTGENRDIVYEGLKKINKDPAPCYARFFGKQDEITSQTLAFSVAPKINAAGRMGDAKAALTLFNESDENKIFDLSVKLTEYNAERQKYCDELYLSAKSMIKEQGVSGNIILLCNENWNAGFVGIVAARLTEEYSCPVILFVKHGDMLKGSARSVENVNIYEALKACGEYIAEFGGHSQAAGVNVTADNFDNLYAALREYISQNSKPEDFIPTVLVNGTLEGGYSPKFVKELELLEPYGVGNRRPMFVSEEEALQVRQVKPLSKHISVKSDKIDFMQFGGLKNKRLLESAAPKKVLFEYNVSSFRGKEYIKGFIRDVAYDASARYAAEDKAVYSFIETLCLPEVKCEIEEISLDGVKNALLNADDGTVFIVWDNSSADLIEGAEKLNLELFSPSNKNVRPTLLFAPFADCDLNAYKRVIFVDNGGYGVRLPSLEGRRVEVYKTNRPAFMDKISCDRDVLLSFYSNLLSGGAVLSGASAEEVVKNGLFSDKAQSYFALKVFEQLELISFESGEFEIHRGVKSKLENSNLYNTVKGGLTR